MSKNILIVTGSARKVRAADAILASVETELKGREDVTITVADLKEITLPFFDAEYAPMSLNFNPTDEHVLAWKKLVGEADGVILLMPEYNHSMTAIQKNALDWLYTEWNDKPVSVVGYGWTGASLALVTAKEILGHLKANLLPTSSHLSFTKDIDLDGSVIDETSVMQSLKSTVDELLNELA